MANKKKTVERSAAGYEFIHVVAPLKKKLDPSKPSRRVVLFERDRAHPGGQAFLAEGDSALVYRTPKVGELIGLGVLKEVGGEKEAKTMAKKVDENSIHSLEGLTDATKALLEKNNVRTINGSGGLVEKRLSGDLAAIKGVAKKRLAEVDHALLEAELVTEDDLT